MAKKFSINTLIVPAKSRSNGMVLGGSVGSVVVNQVGENKNNASTVVNNYITNNYNTANDTYREITIDDLLALPDESKKIGVLYLVYSGGSADSGWSHDSTFLLNGESYPDGTFVTWNITQWEAVSAEVVNVQNTVKMKPLEKTVYIPTQLSSSTSFPRIQEFIRDGIELMRLKAYEKSEEEGVYEPKSYVSGNKQTHEYSVVVPFAYKEGETYHGGALRAEDYKKLFEGGRDGKDAGFGNVTASVDNNTGTPSVIVTTSGDNTAKNFNFEFHNLKGATGQAGKDGVDGKDGKDGIDGSFYIDTTYVEDPSDERVPSSKLFADQINLLLTVGVPLVVSGRLADYYTKSEINTKLGDYVTSSYLSSNYYNKSLLDVSFKALQDSIPTKTSQLTNDSNFATETWVTNKGYVTSTTLTTELDKKENKRQKWFVGQLSENVGGYQTIAILSQNVASSRDYSFLIRVTGDHADYRFSNVMLICGRQTADGMGTPATFEWIEGSSQFVTARLYSIDSSHIAVAIHRKSKYMSYNCEVVDYFTGGNAKITEVTDGSVYGWNNPYLKEINKNVALISDIPTNVSQLNNDAGYVDGDTLASELEKKEGKHDYILMYYDYRKQYSVQHSSGFTNVEVISELSIRIYPAGCTNKNEMRAYLLNHQIQMKQMKRNASNDTIEVKYDAIYQYTVTDSYIQIGINGSSILSPVSAGEIVYYQFCIQKMSYE